MKISDLEKNFILKKKSKIHFKGSTQRIFHPTKDITDIINYHNYHHRLLRIKSELEVSFISVTSKYG